MLISISVVVIVSTVGSVAIVVVIIGIAAIVRLRLPLLRMLRMLLLAVLAFIELRNAERIAVVRSAAEVASRLLRIQTGCIVWIVRTQPGRIEWRAERMNGRLVFDVRLNHRKRSAGRQILIGRDERIVDAWITTQSGNSQLGRRNQQ